MQSLGAMDLGATDLVCMFESLVDDMLYGRVSVSGDAIV
jgi:hypothetical protein